MKRIYPVLCFLIITLLLVHAGADRTDAGLNATYHQEMKEIIGKVSDEITGGLAALERENAKSAGELSGTDLTGTNVSEILNAKVATAPYAISSLIINKEGVVTAAAPPQYENLVGENLSEQTAVSYANTIKKPAISDIFLLKEGFYGVSLSYPIFSKEQEYLGYTDITFKPGEFLRQYIIPMREENNYDMFILQPDGMTIYETNEEEIGKNALTDPLYANPDLHKAAVAITSNTSGVITYPFWNRNWDKTIQRETVWDTLKYGEKEWRIAVVRDISNGTENNSSLSDISSVRDQGDLNASISSITGFVKNATIFAQEKGRQEALSVFNNLSGPYVSGDRYIFAYDMNGTTHALPYQQGLIGENRINLTDENGLEIQRSMIDLVREGGGYLYFVYPNPADGYTPELKLYFIKPVDNEWFVGSGIYLPWIQAKIPLDNLTGLVQRVKGAAIHAGEVGKEKAITDFNDLNGSYADGGSYIFAYEYDGTTLALPHQPDLINSNRLDYTDAYGCPIIRMEIDAAKRGGGYVYIVYYNPDSGKNELKLCYVAPAGDGWLVGSGIYTGQDLST